MKKMLLISLALMVALSSACAPPTVESEPEQAAESLAESSAADDIASSAPAAPEREIPAKSTPESAFQDLVFSTLTTKLREQLVDEETRSVLAERGITVSAEDISMATNVTFSFRLVLSDSGGNKREYNMVGTCAYFRGGGVGFYIFNIEWGGISVASPSVLAVCSLSDISLISMDDLSDTGVSLDRAGFSGKPLGVKYSPATGYAVLFGARLDGDCIAYFDDSGKLVGEKTIPYPENAVNSPFVHGGVAGFGEVSKFCTGMTMLDTQPPLIVFPINLDGDRDYRSILYDTTANETVYIVSLFYTSDKGRYMAAYSGIDAKYGGEHLAVYRDNGGKQKHFFFGGDIHPAFLSQRLGNEPHWDGGRPVAGAFCEDAGLTLTLDFDKNAASLDYNIKPEALDDHIDAVSPNGRYELRSSHLDGGGDVLWYNIVLRDTKTEALYFIATGGGMYGGYENIGFFNNGDIYVQTLDRLRTFSISENGPVPLRPFLMPLGTIEGEEIYRLLFSFRRNPEDKTYIALYGEWPGHNEGSYVGGSLKANYNYKIGFCDADGNLLESYDTGAAVLSDPFGFLGMGLILSGNELSVTARGNKSGITETIGVFNMKTHDYTQTPEYAKY